MSTTSKIQVLTAAFAVAAVATLTPVALADETDTDTTASTTSESTSSAVGSAAGTAPTRSNRKNLPVPTGQAGGSQSSTSAGSTSGATTAETPAATTPDRASTTVDTGTAVSGEAKATAPSAVGANPLFQNPLIWIGQPNPNPPPATPIYQFEPLGNLPEFTQPMFGWLQNFNFEGCVLGLSNTVQGTVGPYGTATQSISTSGCA